MTKYFMFDNITVSGGIGVGTTTLMNNLRPYLEPYGWKFRSAGQLVREYVKNDILPTATLVSDDFDRKLERKTKETLEHEKNWVIEAWLAGFVARDISKTLRVLLHCSNEAIRIDRIVNRDKIGVFEAKQNIEKREHENFKKWKRLYGNHNFFDSRYYQLVIDTYASGPLETVGQVLDFLGYKNSHLPLKNHLKKT